MADSLAQQVFFELHSGLLREAPGAAELTQQALALLPELPRDVRILDIGCGPGAQSLVLARHTAGDLVAVDNHEPFLESLRRRAAEAGLGDRIEARLADMFDLPFAAGSFDVLWSEGSIYIIGFEKGLQTWRHLLKPGGFLVLTEAVWLTDDIPEACREFWHEAYPAMCDLETNLATARACGFEEVGSFVLPESAWWDEYYRPIELRMKELRRDYAGRPEALAVIAEQRAEIELYRRYAGYYGYAFMVLQRD